jgi:dihydroorotase
MGSSTGSLLVDRDEDLERIFANGTRLIAVHAEDEARIRARQRQFADRSDPAVHSEIRDNECARLATARALALSKKYRRRLHILHMSTHEEVELLRRDKPSWVTAEVIPNHLLLNVGDYARLGTLVQMNPPIRGARDNASLWQGLHDGVVDFIATDHAPHTLEEKRRPYPMSPSGMPGVETSLPLMLTEMRAGKCTLAEIQKWMCRGPAEAYGIANKARIVPGYDADLTLVDSTRTAVRKKRCTPACMVAVCRREPPVGRSHNRRWASSDRDHIRDGVAGVVAVRNIIHHLIKRNAIWISLHCCKPSSSASSGITSSYRPPAPVI